MNLVFPNHVRNYADFYGRRDQLAVIKRAYLDGSPNSVVIIGERRIGKTSLQAVGVGLLQEYGKFLPVFVP